MMHNSIPTDRNGCNGGSEYGVIGFSGGIGVGAFLTNATTPGELKGPFMTYSINTPLGCIQYSTGG